MERYRATLASIESFYSATVERVAPWLIAGCHPGEGHNTEKQGVQGEWFVRFPINQDAQIGFKFESDAFTYQPGWLSGESQALAHALVEDFPPKASGKIFFTRLVGHWGRDTVKYNPGERAQIKQYSFLMVPWNEIPVVLREERQEIEKRQGYYRKWDKARNDAVSLSLSSRSHDELPLVLDNLMDTMADLVPKIGHLHGEGNDQNKLGLRLASELGLKGKVSVGLYGYVDIHYSVDPRPGP